MENQHTFGVHFVIRQSRGKSGQAAVYLRITVNKTRCEVSLKCDVNPAEWNHDRGAARPKTETLKQLNSYLEEVRCRLVRHYLNLERKEELVTAAMVKNNYLGIAKDARQQTLLWLVKEHNTQMQKVLEKGSLKNYFTTSVILLLQVFFRFSLLIPKIARCLATERFLFLFLVYCPPPIETFRE